jgi:hypothetical protein
VPFGPASELDFDPQSAVHPLVEGNRVRIRVVEQRAPRPEAQRDRKSSTEWLDETPMTMRRPAREVQVRPPLKWAGGSRRFR